MAKVLPDLARETLELPGLPCPPPPGSALQPVWDVLCVSEQ